MFGFGGLCVGGVGGVGVACGALVLEVVESVGSEVVLCVTAIPRWQSRIVSSSSSFLMPCKQAI